MKYILVLQWSAVAEADYDALIAMEDRLEAGLDGAIGFVDGHDFGSTEMNIFVHTDRPSDAFADVARCLGADPRWAQVRAVFRPTEGDRYEVVWPDTLEEFSVT